MRCARATTRFDLPAPRSGSLCQRPRPQPRWRLQEQRVTRIASEVTAQNGLDRVELSRSANCRLERKMTQGSRGDSVGIDVVVCLAWLMLMARYGNALSCSRIGLFIHSPHGVAAPRLGPAILPQGDERTGSDTPLHRLACVCRARNDDRLVPCLCKPSSASASAHHHPRSEGEGAVCWADHSASYLSQPSPPAVASPTGTVHPLHATTFHRCCASRHPAR